MNTYPKACAADSAPDTNAALAAAPTASLDRSEAKLGGGVVPMERGAPCLLSTCLGHLTKFLKFGSRGAA